MMSVIWLFNSPEESDCSLEVIIGILLSQALSSLPQDIKTKKNRLRKGVNNDNCYDIILT